VMEMCWGDAGATLAIFGSTLGVGIANAPNRRQWVPQCFGTPEKSAPGAFCGRPDAEAASAPCRGGLRRGQGRVGAQRRTKTWITNGIAGVHVVASVDPSSPAVDAGFVVPPGSWSPWAEVQKHGIVPAIPPGRARPSASSSCL
jgi:hypothetical protein